MKIVRISENSFNSPNTHTYSTVSIYAQDTCPGLLVITEFFAKPSRGTDRFYSSSQSFLPDGWIDHDEDGKPFIRSRCASQTERARKAQRDAFKGKEETNHQHVASDTDACATQENSLEKNYGLRQASSGSPMPPVKAAGSGQ